MLDKKAVPQGIMNQCVNRLSIIAYKNNTTNYHLPEISEQQWQQQ